VILIIARFETKPDYSERWPELVAPLTAATRAEPGNL
jgi:quinol monooxygenase YgiN